MNKGKIWVANNDGVYLIKMVGDVRLTLCMSFDKFIKSMFAADDYSAIIFDLTDAESIDSTTLGLMAKIALGAAQRKNLKPAVIATAPGMHHLLESMGFDEIFELMDDSPVEDLPATGSDCLETGEYIEQTIKQKVLEAHKILMDLNRQNAETFRDLVKTLEDSR
ncbi:MAG: STAS domain-containing protein [Gammaproteobacteria bacterium]|uniref:STAS domain-containing protein n=1 Tax=Pseudomaricurvus alcaniphilus TaxID=1166482 RepID=UPI00140750C6|nr:STAS domain-containing protein [Pseudomaricurvus alcaniphilus]MBR9912404.1 STAS domain-containing protein [Gammaproteobacteria bacterium]NHN36763.1 STAS domain-containing protein [Pseudomaricurvus alcaniphilus]